MGSEVNEDYLKALGGYGADRVYYIDSPLLKDYTTDGYAKALCDLIMDKKPEIMLIGATNRHDVLDEAILRRFSLHHEVTPPQTAEEAAQVMRAFLDDLSNPLFKVQYDTDFVANLCKENPGKPQSWLVNKAIESVAVSLKQEVQRD